MELEQLLPSMTVGADKLELPELPGVDGQTVVHFVSGRDDVLRLGPRLEEFSTRCGEAGAMRDLAYFLSKPGALPRIPYLLLVGTASLDVGYPDLDELLGFLLIFEQRVSGFGLGAFATNDRSGRSTLIAMPADRGRVAGLTSRALLDRGAHLILMSYQADTTPESYPAGAASLLTPEHGKSIGRWARRERAIPGYLPLAMTFDATLARVGQRTRRNLRYYRRRAESALGCVFLRDVQITREELLGFNDECMFAPSAEVAGWRYDSLQELSEPVFMGIKDREGRWLSMLGGRRYQGRSEILWQMNRGGFAAHSLATVMRSYYLEHEVAHGSSRLYMEGGTPHTIRNSFVPEYLTDLVVVRRSVAATVMRSVALRYISRENELSHMLGAKDLEWLPC